MWCKDKLYLAEIHEQPESRLNAQGDREYVAILRTQVPKISTGKNTVSIYYLSLAALINYMVIIYIKFLAI